MNSTFFNRKNYKLNVAVTVIAILFDQVSLCEQPGLATWLRDLRSYVSSSHCPGNRPACDRFKEFKGGEENSAGPPSLHS